MRDDKGSCGKRKGINYVNGASWYRVWTDGWIEQGGIADYSSTSRSPNMTITFLKPFLNLNYTINASLSLGSGSGNSSMCLGIISQSTTGFATSTYGVNTSDYARYTNWRATGY